MDRFEFVHPEDLPVVKKQFSSNIGGPFYCIKEKRTGFGLMWCHKIVENHGGHIRIHSTINKGTTVDEILPVKQTKVSGGYL